MNNGQGELALHAPVLDNDSLEGPANRAKLLRAWIEISAWLADFAKQYGLFLCLSLHQPRPFKGFSPSLPPLATELADHHRARTSVNIDSVRELYQTAIGAHLEQCRSLKMWPGTSC